jgi:hypothetical protein
MRISLIYIESGGGHRTAAYAPAELIRLRRLPWDVRLEWIQSLLIPAMHAAIRLFHHSPTRALQRY